MTGLYFPHPDCLQHILSVCLSVGSTICQHIWNSSYIPTYTCSWLCCAACDATWILSSPLLSLQQGSPVNETDGPSCACSWCMMELSLWVGISSLLVATRLAPKTHTHTLSLSLSLSLSLYLVGSFTSLAPSQLVWVVLLHKRKKMCLSHSPTNLWIVMHRS
jgi:hypothetical protein